MAGSIGLPLKAVGHQTNSEMNLCISGIKVFKNQAWILLCRCVEDKFGFKSAPADSNWWTCTRSVFERHT